MDADLEKTRNNGFDTVIKFVDGFIVSVAVDTSDFGGFFAESFEEVFGLINKGFGIGGAVIWNDNEERFIHNVSFLGEEVDEVDIVVHEYAEKHVVVIAANGGETVDVGADVDALRADKDLDTEVQGV